MAGVTVVGENGVLKVTQGDNGIAMVDGNGLVDADVIYAPEVNGKLGGVVAREADHFVEMAIGKVDPVCTAADGAAAVRASLALETAARERRTVRL
jgi:predicted dehydrogenase